MKVIDLINLLELTVYSGSGNLDRLVAGGYVSDLLSDVIGNATENQVWITLQTHPNIVAVASLKDLAAIILVRGLEPDPETIRHSEEEKIPVVGTKLNAFEITGRLYNLLKH
jgi:hypothetical protein